MTIPKVLVLGSTGMLGKSVEDAVADGEFDYIASSRSVGLRFNAESDDCNDLADRAGLVEGDYIVNCIGLTKYHLRANDAQSITKAVTLNTLFPARLAIMAESRNVKVIQAATDCVFSGGCGAYVESSPHDAEDVYGKSKSLGEISSNSMMHLRCSLIGPEQPGRQTLLFEWVRGLSYGAQIRGFVNHRWNGLTSQAFGKLVAAIISRDLFAPGVQHLVPRDTTTKHDLIKMILELLDRSDVVVETCDDSQPIDRTLSSERSNLNALLFQNGGYSRVPSIREMMEALPWDRLRERKL